MNFVYLLPNQGGDAFKIGVSLNPAQRGAQLPQNLDWSKSLQVPMGDGNAYKVEKLLHYLFRDHSREMPVGDGYTEWFSIEAWGGVLAFLSEQRERLGIGDAQPVALPLPKAVIKSNGAFVLMDRLSRREREQKERVSRAYQLAITKNPPVVQRFIVRLNALWRDKKLTVHFKGGDCWLYLLNAPGADVLLSEFENVCNSDNLICDPQCRLNSIITSSTSIDGMFARFKIEFDLIDVCETEWPGYEVLYKRLEFFAREIDISDLANQLDELFGNPRLQIVGTNHRRTTP
jgi:hypothetical protein|nr:hypothetical protein [uncultured bacterium]